MAVTADKDLMTAGAAPLPRQYTGLHSPRFDVEAVVVGNNGVLQPQKRLEQDVKTRRVDSVLDCGDLSGWFLEDM